MPETFEYGKAYKRTPENELYLRATTMFSGQDSFYEKAEDSDKRAIELGRDIAVKNWEWFSQFLPWLRSEGNIRTMPMVLAVEGVQARLNAKITGFCDGITHRQVVDKVLQRPDEPGKMLGYYFKNYGKNVPKPVKRGIADSLTRMLNQRQALRYDKPGDEIRLGDVIEFTHPGKKNDLQGLLFQHLITNRHDREGYEPDFRLDEIRARWELDKLTPDQRHEFGRKLIAQDAYAQALWEKALAGSWEWGKLFFGEK